MENRTLKLNLYNSYRSLPSRFYSNAKESSFPKVELVIYNEKLSDDLGIVGNEIKNNIEILSGNTFIEGSHPLSQAYAGHQFGYFNMLGDGRAILLGEYISNDNKRIDIQLKGSGRTLYSRGGDGKASLSPMLREYIISEAMFGLGIPTTRSLAVVKTGEEIFRNEFEVGAVLTRVADSHLRVGTFQFAAMGEKSEIKELADYSIDRHYPDLNEYDDSEKYVHFLDAVIDRQAKLISKWQLVGFIHGVMNTDNMTISGETIDYGPCAFMNRYDENTVFSSIDRDGRYRYGNQMRMGQWNLSRLADALVPIIDDNQDVAIQKATESIKKYNELVNKYWLEGMLSKLGFGSNFDAGKELIQHLLYLMYMKKADFTNTFYRLTYEKANSIVKEVDGTEELFDSDEFKKWRELWEKCIELQDITYEECVSLMKKSNPVIIPRNYIVEDILEGVVKKNDMDSLYNFLSVLSNPYNYEYSSVIDVYGKVSKDVDKGYKTYCGT